MGFGQLRPKPAFYVEDRVYHLRAWIMLGVAFSEKQKSIYSILGKMLSEKIKVKLIIEISTAIRKLISLRHIFKH